MKKTWTKTLLIMLALVLVLGTLAGCNKNKQSNFEHKDYTMEERTAARAVQLAKSTLEKYVDQELYSSDNEIYIYDSYNPWTDETDGEASVWHYTSVVAMANRLTAITSGDNKNYFNGYCADLWDEMDWYKGSAEITSYRSKKTRTMYAVDRAYNKNTANIKGIKAVYDDQMWIIREMLSTYANTGDNAYLADAETLTDVCLDGWDDTINPVTGTEFGGITWGPGYRSKHTCSNAPMVAPLVDLYYIYKDKEDKIGNVKKADYYLDWAKKIYDFSYATFKNTNDLYGDLVGSEGGIGSDGLKITTIQGTLDISEYTYNTGTMIQGGAKLYQATKNATYLEQAQNSAEAAYRLFGKKDATTGLSEYPTSSTLWFNFELLLGFVELAYADDSAYASVNKTYVDSFREALDYAYDNFYHDGLLPRNYVKGWVPGIEFDEEKNVMDSAAGAEMYALIYQYYCSLK